MYKKLLSFLIVFSLLQNMFSQQKKVKIDHNTFGAIKARHIGPARMSGRISSIDAVQKNPRIVYAGSAGGGLWKSSNAGVTFKSIFDKHNQSIGAIAIDQLNPDTVWVGTGEPWTRNSVSIGDGIYVSYDGGQRWIKRGLEKTERIGRIRIHPKNPNIVFVAALGKLWGQSKERGVFRTKDGGKTWEKTLFINTNTGCSDLVIHPEDPNIVFAAMWDFLRQPHTFRSGGPGSGLYKSVDGGKTWNKITKGLPSSTLGRIAIAISPTKPFTIYALIESKKSALYRSKDNGETWEMTNNNSKAVSERPFYFANIYTDPIDTNRIWKPGFTLMTSKNGGKEFFSPGITRVRYHVDLHGMWISKKDNNFIYIATDGGVYKSNDKGKTWVICRNLPVSQFYHVSIDNDKPYNVYGGLQDNGSWMGPSRSNSGIKNSDWKNLGGGDGFYVYRDKLDPSIYYSQYQGGNISRFHKLTNERKDIKPCKDNSVDNLRFNWNTPVHFSKDSKRLYIGAQYLYRSFNRGESWERISPDLTTNAPDKQKQEESGGLTIDNSTAENHCTIYTINESTLDKNIIWVGTDDGNLHVTTNGGKTWEKVSDNISSLPSERWCSSVFSSQHNKGAAYATFDIHRSGDNSAYVYKTTDLGKTWEKLTDKNLDSYCHFILEDIKNKDLLFLGTEWGLFITINGGKKWSRFNGNIPKVSIREIVLNKKNNDLILATHGRGILIIDDISPLRDLTEDLIQKDVAFLSSRPYIIQPFSRNQEFAGDDEFIGRNPESAAYITYYMRKRHIFGDMFIEIYNKNNELEAKIPAGKRRGINRVSWITYKKPPKMPPARSLVSGGFIGPPYQPGEYYVKIIKKDKTYEGTVSLKYPENWPHTKEDRQVQHAQMMKAYKLIEELTFTDAQITQLMKRLTIIKKAKNKPSKLASIYHEKLNEIHKLLVATKKGDITGEEQLREKLSSLYGSIASYGGKPTKSQIEELLLLEKELSHQKEKIEILHNQYLNKLNKQLENEKRPKLKLLTKEKFNTKENV